MRTSKLITTIALAGAMTLMTTSLYAKDNSHRNGKPGTAVIYVASQELFYDTLLLGALPYNETDNFQELVMTPDGPYTESGPGDTGYYGGRWWIDNGSGDDNGNGIMDASDTYFLCPLLGPGRDEP